MGKMENLLVGVDEFLGISKTQGKKLYKYWLDNHAKEHITKWLEEHEYSISSCKTPEYVEYITKHFIDWIAGDK